MRGVETMGAHLGERERSARQREAEDAGTPFIAKYEDCLTSDQVYSRLLRRVESLRGARLRACMYR